MNSNDLAYWVWLSHTFAAGSERLLQMLRLYETPGAVYEALMDGTAVLQPEHRPKLTLEQAGALADSCVDQNITLIPITDPRYPNALRSISLPPALLTAQGNVSLLAEPLALTIVGTRKPEPYSEKVVQSVIAGLEGSRFVIVSGFAVGIDSIAHSAALTHELPTIAVMGCGLNVEYPKGSHAFKERFIGSGNGLMISEYLPGTPPNRANFPKRNRILSGLSAATAVIEAGTHSGSLITARSASDQGRFVFSVPPANVFDDRYGGQSALLRDGAIPLMDAEDVKRIYFAQYPQCFNTPPEQHAERMIIAEKPAPKTKAKRRSAKPEPPAPAQPAPAPAPTVTMPTDETGRRIVECLQAHGMMRADDMAAELDLDLSVLLDALMELELDGVVESLFGKQYRIFGAMG